MPDLWQLQSPVTLLPISLSSILSAPTFAASAVCSVAFSRVRLSSPNDCRPPGSSVHGILQARILEWVAILFSRQSSQPRG